MNDRVNFQTNPLTALLLGVDDEKMEDMDLHEVINRVIREKVKNDGMSEDEIDAKATKAKKRLANLISMNDRENMNPLFLLLGIFGFGGGNMMTDGFRGVFADKDGNKMPEDVFKNEFMPLSGRASSIDTIIRDIEELTEENTRGNTVPDIARDLFACKDELLEFLKGRKAQLEEKLKKIIERYMKKGGGDLDKTE